MTGMPQREQRVTYRTLRYLFDVDEACLHAVRDELPSAISARGRRSGARLDGGRRPRGRWFPPRPPPPPRPWRCPRSFAIRRCRRLQSLAPCPYRPPCWKAYRLSLWTTAWLPYQTLCLS